MTNPTIAYVVVWHMQHMQQCGISRICPSATYIAYAAILIDACTNMQTNRFADMKTHNFADPQNQRNIGTHIYTATHIHTDMQMHSHVQKNANTCRCADLQMLCMIKLYGAD